MLVGKKNSIGLGVLLLIQYLNYCDSLIVPQELPSLLSIIYSNIPPIKKGTDSRVGFGFRLGEHADFQILLELGPQKATRPIGGKDADPTFNKRQVSKSDQLAVQRQQQREQTSTERSVSTWLENWSKDMNATKKKTKQKHHSGSKKHTEKNIIMAAVPAMPEQSLIQLQSLYKMATSPEITGTTPSSDQRNEILLRDGTSQAQLSLNFGRQETFSPPELSVGTLQNEPLARTKTKSEITKELMDVSLDGDE